MDVDADKAKIPWVKAMNESAKLDKEVLKTVPKFFLPYNLTGAGVEWKVEMDGDELDYSSFDVESPEIDIDMTKSISDNIFNLMFPSVEGYRKIIDEYLSDSHSSYYSTYKQTKKTFHRETAQDPDYLVKQSYLVLIAGCTEFENGISNLWKSGESGGWRKYLDFGMYMSENVFKLYISAAPFAWAKKEHWFTDKRG